MLSRASVPPEVLATWSRRRRNPVGKIAAATVVLALLGLLALAVANGKFKWSVVSQYLTSTQIAHGAELTIFLTITAMLLGMVLGVLFGVARLSSNVVVSGVAWLYVWVFRGTPVLIQLLLWFNFALVFPRVGFPGLGGVSTNSLLTPFIAATLALGVNEGAYLSEIVRGGILSVDEGQREAALAIGASSFHLNRRIVLPQTIRVIIPTLGNETIGMLKTTSLASTISVQEMLGVSQQIYFTNAAIMELLIVDSVWYLAMTSVLSIGQYYLERHFGRSMQRARPRTLVERMALKIWQSVVPSLGKTART